jgi:hypothetical protein
MRAQSDKLPPGVPAPNTPPLELTPEPAPQLNFWRYGLNVLHRRRLMRLAMNDDAYRN